MYKVVGLIALTISIAVGLTSCQDKKYCYDCVTDRYYVTLPEGDTTRIDSDLKVHCDEDAESIKQVEANGTSYLTYTKDGKVVQEYTVTKCKP